MSLHGSTSDFFTLAPVEPVVFRVLPADFDAEANDMYLDAPDAREVDECRHCALRSQCTPEHFAKPECQSAQEIQWGNVKPKRMTKGYARDSMCAVLRQFLVQGPATRMQLSIASGIGYWSIRDLLDHMVSIGMIECIGQNRTNKRGTAGNVYALKGWEG